MFGIFRIRGNFLRLARGGEILVILFRFAVVNWMSSRRFFLRFVPAQYKKNGIVQSQPQRFRTVIEELGPTFIKFGQVLADRPDMVSEKMRMELKKLQSTVEPFSHIRAVELIEQELGGPVDRFFEKFDSDCIGSASIGQVYKARLKGGEEVIVKIQRPGIQEKIGLDLEILKYLAAQLVKEYPGLTAVDVVGAVDEFGETLLKELNYLNEASNAIRFAAMFKDVDYCKIPKVHIEMTTAKMLVMEYVSGIRPDNVQELIANGIDPKLVAHNGTVMLLEMIFKHGFFHADPHAGNLFIASNNTIILLDFGMAGTLKPSHMQFLAGFTMGLALGKASIITDSLLTLCGKKFFHDRENLEFSVQDMLKRFGSFEYEQMQFSLILNESMKIIMKYELRLPGSMYLLVKSLATIEKFGYQLDPGISLPGIIRPYAEHLIKEKYSPKEIAGDLYDTIKDYISLIRDFPGEMNEILYRLKQGKIGVDINLADHQILLNSFKQLGGILALTILIGFMLAVSAFLLYKGKATTGAEILFGISVFFSLWLILRLFVKTKL